MGGGPSKDVIDLLSTLHGGDEPVAVEFTQTTYRELRRIAGFLMAREPPGQTLQATALVHEAYLKLVGGEQVEWSNRRHFINTVVRGMREVLIDRARRYATVKHGGGRRRVDLDAIDVGTAEAFPPEHAAALDRALHRLHEANARWAEIVQLRFFAGLTVQQTAELLEVSPALVKKDWSFTRPWLIKALRDEGASGAVGEVE